MAGAAYVDELAWLYGLESRGVKLGLERMRAAVAHRGHPERDLRVIHVAGSNGKGSVCAMLESSLRAAGHRTGWFSSPHLHRYVERVRVDGRPITEKEAAERLASLRCDPALSELSFFEHTTLLALETFRDAGCDAVVLEVGLGGRLDSTNVVRPEVAVITNIALEHQAILGDTVGAIAREKAGIIKRGAPVVVGVREPAALRPIRDRIRRVGTEGRFAGQDFDASVQKGGIRVRVGERVLEGLTLGLAGSHQVENAACAVATLEALKERGMRVDDLAVWRGMAKARWPGRLEWIPGEPAFLLDSAHNAAGCERLAAHLASLGPRRRRRRVVLLFGAMSDKDHEAMLAPFDDLVERRVYAAPAMARAADPESLAWVRPGVVARSVRDGLARARRSAGEGGLVVVAGSIFLVASARAGLKGVRSDPLIGM